MKYERILLKVSGEVLSGKTPIDFDNVTAAAEHIKALHGAGCKIGVVVGGGNIWRGRSSGTMDRNRADNIGMLATAANALALEQALIDLSVPVRVLSAAGIPYYTTESVKSKYEGFIFRDFRDYVSLACGTGGNREILNVLNHPNRYLRDKEFRAVEEFTDDNMYEAVIRETSSKEEWQRDRAIDSISCWLDHFGPGRIDMSMYPHTVWNAFIDGIDYLRYIEDYSRDRNLDYEDLQEEVKDLNGEALDFEKLEDWFRHADAETAKLREEMAKKDRNGVVLTTMHRAKGLEWDVVYIIDADEYITPHKKSMQDAAQMEEERRLFYVAMTRAKDELIVLGSGTPSRFISEMNETVKRGATSAPKPAKNSFVISPDKVQKKLAGAGVEHKKFGPGRVDHYEPGVIVVTFKEHGEKKFQFPETFCKGIIWYTT